jgi:MoaA/NifB/PqqE/SkfB family radical SAM enzyme
MWISARNLLHHLWSRSPRGFHPLLAVHYLTYACAFRCPYCSDGSGVPYHALRSPTLDAGRTLELLGRVRRRCDWLVLTGGEPLDHPEVDQVLRGLPRLGFDGVVLTTVGAALDRHLDAVDAAVRHLVVSLDTLDGARGDRWLGRPGAHARILANLEAAARRPRRRYEVMLSSVATPENLGDLAEVRRFARERGFRHAVSPQLLGVHPHPGLRRHPGYRALYDGLIADRRRGLPTYGSVDYLAHMRDLRAFRCRPSTVLATSPAGDVSYPCLEIGKVAGNLLDEPDLDAIRRAGRERHGPEPHCQPRCQSPCALGFALPLDRPGAALADLRWELVALLRRAGAGLAQPFRRPRPAARPG